MDRHRPGAHREVDVAGHDDEHHARGHDGRAARLHRERDHVRGADELAAREDVEADEDDEERQRACRTGVRRSRSPRGILRREVGGLGLVGGLRRGAAGSAHRSRSWVAHDRSALRPGPAGSAGRVTTTVRASPRSRSGLRSSGAAGDDRWPASAQMGAARDGSSTCAQSTSSASQSPSTTRFRFSWVIGVGWRMNDVTVLPPGVSKSAACSVGGGRRRRVDKAYLGS